MRDATRIDRIVEKLRQVWHQSPELRLCQLLFIVSHSEHPVPDFFYTEDEFLELQFEEFKKDLEDPNT